MPAAIPLQKTDGKPGQVYYPFHQTQLPDSQLAEDEVFVSIIAAALNHRDLFRRQHSYPGVGFEIPLFSDGCGMVVATGSSPTAKVWSGRRVILKPCTRWTRNTEAPQLPEGCVILGDTKRDPKGTLAETITIEAKQLELAPRHITSVEAAALPLTGLTAWRAVMTKSGHAAPGRHMIVTGIGGGVALMALIFAVGAGAKMYVTSGNRRKLDLVRSFGASEGVDCHDIHWHEKLLKKRPPVKSRFDAIIDSAGGDSRASHQITQAWGCDGALRYDYLTEYAVSHGRHSSSPADSRGYHGFEKGVL